MSNENPVFSYTNRDYESARKEGLAKIPIISKGEYTDLNATDPGVIILDYVHALVDMANYYQDHQALETFISTAKERKNIFRIAKQLSYKIRSSKGAVCDVTFTTSLLYENTIKIPKYTVVTTNSDISYLTSEDAYILPGEHTVTVPCSQGTLNTVTYIGTGESRFSQSVGAKNQSITLIAQHIDIDSIVITDSLGRIWTPVDYIIFTTEIDRAYEVVLNPDDTITIKFGDGERGIVPSESDILTISYVSTLAEEGRVSANTLVNLQSEIRDNQGNYIDLTVINNKASSGGSSTPSTQEVKELAPGAIKAQDRAVTLSDFENLAKLVDGVADAKAYDINTKPELCLYHEVKVLIVPKDKEGSIDLLKSRVHEYLSARMIPPTNLQVLSPSSIQIDIEIVVRKLENTTEGRLSYLVQQSVIDYFKAREGEIGEPFYPSDLLSRISILDGVRSILSMTPNTAVYAEELSVLCLGNLNITVM